PTISRDGSVTLVPSHRNDLRASGITDATAALAELYSAPERQVRDLLGYGAGPGLVFQYPSLNGSGAYARVKLDQAGPDGKRCRSPARQPNRVYVPPLLDRKILADTSAPLWLTEGEKKALKACQEGLPCLALPGVWSWKTRGADGKSGPSRTSITSRGRTASSTSSSTVTWPATPTFATPNMRWRASSAAAARACWRCGPRPGPKAARAGWARAR